MDYQIDFNHYIDITHQITSWESFESTSKNLQLDENKTIELYTYLSSHYGKTKDVYDFSNGKQIIGFCLNYNDFLSLIEMFNLPIEPLNKGSNIYYKEDIYIGFYLSASKEERGGAQKMI
jgi:hypothetical protein